MVSLGPGSPGRMVTEVVGAAISVAASVGRPPRPTDNPWGERVTRASGGRLTFEVNMSLNLEQKQAVVAEVAKQVAGAQAIVMAENRGMPVHAMTQLRAKARASGVYFRVVKNTLVRRAVAETPFAKLSDRMVGPLAYGIGPDPVAVAKVLSDFAKGNDKFVITGGAMPGQVMTVKEITSLASLPSREQLIAKLL